MPKQMSPQPTNAQGQTAVVGNIVHLLKDLKPLVEKYKINLQKQKNDDIGFNLFELISDHYYRETFHSDILNAFLDPTGKHNEKDLYLRLFLIFINSHLEPIVKLEEFSHAQVVKEEDRIDILIKDEKSKKAIIIENKINGACDQPRQLPDYLKKVTDKGYVCDAIIYLRLNGNIPPDETRWYDDEREKVKRILRIICAYDGTDDGTGKDLLKGWILKCAAESNNNSDAQHILRQYGGIIKKLGRDTMNKPIMDEFYKAMVKDEGENLKTALALKEMLDNLVLYRVEKIIEKFKCNLKPFSKIAIASGNDAYFEGECNGSRIGLDILVDPKSYQYQVRFWDKDDRQAAKNCAKNLLQKMSFCNEYTQDVQNAGWFCRDFMFPEEEENLIKHIADFKQELDKAIKSLSSSGSMRISASQQTEP